MQQVSILRRLGDAAELDMRMCLRVGVFWGPLLMGGRARVVAIFATGA